MLVPCGHMFCMNSVEKLSTGNDGGQFKNEELLDGKLRLWKETTHPLQGIRVVNLHRKNALFVLFEGYCS
ncbi:hypothetical protein QJS10_CPA01g02282 [Acorus calamus]|uniref:Uncharacterized protein n=1 Tax=Acorus calamus TaxID=4465 RepID=A0AAV9FJW0_ACOCL|nr:hypothetical protein QJS10_CPA01g02282 [Acorus calamus]